MSTATKDSVTFSTQITAKPERVSRETGEMFGARALQFGKLSPTDVRPWKVDRTTLEQLSGLINKNSKGAKMRPGHPDSRSSPITMAKGANARIVEEGNSPFVAIDVKFTKASEHYQNGEWRKMLFEQADETPEDVGLSIDAVLDRKAMKTKDADGLIPIRLSSLNAIDFVDDAAATSGGLFSPEESDMSTENTDHAAELATLKTEFAALKKANEELTSKLSTLTSASVVDPKEAEKAEAKAELARRGEITALCTLAKVSDAERDLFLSAGFSRAEAQDFLKSSGKLSVANPPISEGGNDPLKKDTPEEKFGAEYDKNRDLFSRQGVTRDQFIFSRKVDEGLETLASKPTKAA